MSHRNIYMTDELQAIYDQTVDFVAKEVTPHGEQWEDDGKVPREVLQQMGALGMFGLRVPEELGGLGMGMLASATFSEALGSSTYAGFDVTVLVHTDMAGPHLVNSGSPEQLERWLPGVLSGETILSIGVTEPDAGCDVAGIRTSAVKDGDGWRINGDQDVHHERRLRRPDDRRRQDRPRQQVRHHDVPRAGRHRGLLGGEEARQARLAMFRHRRTRARRRVGCPTTRCSAPCTAASTRR